MRTLLNFIFALALITTTGFTNAEIAQHDSPDSFTQESIVSGHKVQLFSPILDEQRTVLIQLPVGYEDNPQRRYPVLYTLDGDTHFRHISGTVDWLSEQANQIPRMIVVAITNTQRGRDMSASYNKGGADKFLEFIQAELIPFIDSHYQTQPFRILAGHSMAGHFALNVFNQKPDLFNAFITMSPWFHQDRGETSLIDLLAEQFKQPLKTHHFLYTSIGDEVRLKPKYEKFINVLNGANSPQLKWNNFVSDSDNHMSIPSNTVNNALRFIFNPMRLATDSPEAKAGIESVRSYYTAISQEIYGYDISPEPAINSLGYDAMFTKKDNQKAIEIFKTNVALHPKSANAHDSLADGYQRNGQLKLALESVQRAIELASNESDIAFYERRKQRIVTDIETTSP